MVTIIGILHYLHAAYGAHYSLKFGQWLIWVWYLLSTGLIIVYVIFMVARVIFNFNFLQFVQTSNMYSLLCSMSVVVRHPHAIFALLHICLTLLIVIITVLFLKEYYVYMASHSKSICCTWTGTKQPHSKNKKWMHNLWQKDQKNLCVGLSMHISIPV